VDEHRLLIGGHELEGRDLIIVFFRLGNVIAADEDVRMKRRMGETEKGFPTGVSWPARRIAVQ
jgi:hypothetical protein